MNSNGSNQQQLTSGNTDEESPVWSPDGTKIAFISVNKKKGKVAVISADGSSQKILTNDNSDNFDLSWLPNNREIGFTSDGEVYTVSISGGLKNRINIPAQNLEEPSWKP